MQAGAWEPLTSRSIQCRKVQGRFPLVLQSAREKNLSNQASSGRARSGAEAAAAAMRPQE